MTRFECTLFKFEHGKATPYTLSLEEIAANEREGKKLLGTAAGRDIWHCLHLGARHGEKEFLHQIKWYYINPEENEFVQEMRQREQETIVVEFYGEKR